MKNQNLNISLKLLNFWVFLNEAKFGSHFCIKIVTTIQIWLNLSKLTSWFFYLYLKCLGKSVNLPALQWLVKMRRVWCRFSQGFPQLKPRHANLHTDKTFWNIISSSRNQIVFTTFQLIWIQTIVHLDPNQSENGPGDWRLSAALGSNYKGLPWNP